MKDKIERLEEINNYYHEQIEEMLYLLHFIEDDFEMKYNIPLPLEFYEKVTNIIRNFKFKY